MLSQPYDMEVGAGTMSPDTFLRVLGPDPVAIAYTQPSRRPADGRYGENPNRLYKHLLVQPNIEAVRLVDPAVEVDLLGAEEQCSDLLASVIRDGFRIVDFHPRGADLEQIFMTVTRGEVQ